MFALIANWLLNALALYIVSKVVTGVLIVDFWAALGAVIAISLLNVLLKPLLVLLTLPITLITLGLFSFILNALLFSLAGSLAPGFRVDGFMSALVGSLLYSAITTLLRSMVK